MDVTAGVKWCNTEKPQVHSIFDEVLMIISAICSHPQYMQTNTHKTIFEQILNAFLVLALWYCNKYFSIMPCLIHLFWLHTSITEVTRICTHTLWWIWTVKPCECMCLAACLEAAKEKYPTELITKHRCKTVIYSFRTFGASEKSFFSVSKSINKTSEFTPLV